MPTYEYECAKCAHAFEAFQGIRDKPLGRCPKCGGRVKRLPGGGGALLFKGKGFYQTDYRSSAYRKAASADVAPAVPAAPASGDKGTASAAPSAAGGKK